MDTSLVLEDFFSRSKIPPMSNVLTLVHGGLLSDGPQKETFSKVQRKVIYFLYVVRKEWQATKNCRKNNKKQMWKAISVKSNISDVWN